jgi:phosphatidylethanolamine N-methyltransferase
MSPSTRTILHYIHAFIWRVVHSLGLGLLLRFQSDRKFMVRHYLKHYHFAENGRSAVVEAFENWKQIYTLSLSMTYGERLPIVDKHAANFHFSLVHWAYT